MKWIHASSLQTVLLLAIAPAALASTTWYVDGVNGSDNNNCMSSQTACKTIKHAIKIASSGDSIMVAAATYPENLNISISVNVIGSGAATTILDGRHRRQAVVTINKKAAVTLSQVTIQNAGRGIAGHGSGIYNVGTVTINDSVINGNHAGIGGGIFNDGGTLTLNNSTVSGNQGKNAGGVVNGGTMTINNSTLSNNFAPEGPGAIGNGGALTIINSTFSGNSAYAISGNITNQGGALTISNSTISGNSVRDVAAGGIVGTATLQNTILANNTGGNCYGGVTSNGYSLSSDATCSFSGAGDMNSTDPQLGPLQDNGGPTQTMALPAGSPAIDAGNPAGCKDDKGKLLTTDQRGKPRPDKGETGCDMGAYESQSN